MLHRKLSLLISKLDETFSLIPIIFMENYYFIPLTFIRYD